MSLPHWPPWALVAAALAALLLALVAAERPGRMVRPERPLIVTGAPAQAPEARVCVTRHGICPIGPARAGDPCGCPHPLRGSVPGHVEPVEGEPVLTDPRAWPEAEDEDPLAGLGPLAGP